MMRKLMRLRRRVAATSFVVSIINMDNSLQATMAAINSMMFEGENKEDVTHNHSAKEFHHNSLTSVLLKEEGELQSTSLHS
eukprot:COSAG06_NODE_218_length_20036_cov_21.649446_12_plen_81_part_00